MDKTNTIAPFSLSPTQLSLSPPPMAPALAALPTPPGRLGADSGTPASGRLVRVTARPVGRGRGRRRCSLAVRAGGPPSTNVLILAFVLPLSLFVGTLVAAARVSDDLDERFLREMEVNKAILEEDEASSSEVVDGEDDDEEAEEVVPPAVEKEEALVTASGAPSRTRSRPKREV